MALDDRSRATRLTVGHQPAGCQQAAMRVTQKARCVRQDDDLRLRRQRLDGAREPLLPALLPGLVSERLVVAVDQRVAPGVGDDHEVLRMRLEPRPSGLAPAQTRGHAEARLLHGDRHRWAG